jgi:hypothetical protein
MTEYAQYCLVSPTLALTSLPVQGHNPIVPEPASSARNIFPLTFAITIIIVTLMFEYAI